MYQNFNMNAFSDPLVDPMGCHPSLPFEANTHIPQKQGVLTFAKQRFHSSLYILTPP